ncbi:anti-sigma factor domain-containing protein [Neobacillus sp. NRS-1170]|uniref:anti-sigma factor domain-containing protein n=1 Tax=Neobacillus sp. NRS-1170 TaxID=3233898 RepID=UPI003D2A5A08
MKKGIVMKIDNGFLTLLTPEGEFLRARKQDQAYSIGEEIHFFPIESSRTDKSFHGAKNILRQKSVWAAAMAFIIILGGAIIPMFQNDKAYAYMSIDVNPSIELGINKKMQVVEITGYNKEGKKVISELDDWENQNVSDVTKAILAEMKDEGYLNKNEKIILSTVRTKQLAKDAEEKLQKNIKEIKSAIKKQQLKPTYITETEETREIALKEGKTTGKYKSKLFNTVKDNEKTIENNKENKKENKKTAPPTQSVKTEIVEKTEPHGQIKKQIENTTINNTSSENKNNRVGGNSVPPGQLKKMEEETIKQNYGQTKKQSVQKENPSQKDKVKNNEKKNEKAKVNLNVNLDDKHVNLEVHLNGLIDN